MKTKINKYIIGGIASIALFMLPYIILGENAYITIHDFLDQNVVIMATLKKTGLLTSISGTVPNMDGLDRSLFPFFTPSVHLGLETCNVIINEAFKAKFDFTAFKLAISKTFSHSDIMIGTFLQFDCK